MRFNHFTIAALPELNWTTEPMLSLTALLEDFQYPLEPLTREINDLFLLNDIRNLEILVRSQLNLEEKYRGNREDGTIDYFEPQRIAPRELENLLQDPAENHPYEPFPEFITEYLLIYLTPEDRFSHIEELYIGYMRYLQQSSNAFIRYYGRIASAMRSVSMYSRLMRKGLDPEKHLRGEPEIVETILAHRGIPDLGLREVFPEVFELISFFEKERHPMEFEEEITRLRFRLMEETGKEAPFGDHVILAYLMAYQIRKDWLALDKIYGLKVVNNILEDKY